MVIDLAEYRAMKNDPRNWNENCIGCKHLELCLKEVSQYNELPVYVRANYIMCKGKRDKDRFYI